MYVLLSECMVNMLLYVVIRHYMLILLLNKILKNTSVGLFSVGLINFVYPEDISIGNNFMLTDLL